MTRLPRSAIDPATPVATRPRPARPAPPARAEPTVVAPATGSTYTGGGHLRATLLLLLVAILLLGVAYPLALVGFGQLVNPHGANGSLNHNPNGSVSNSSLVPPPTNTTVGGPIPHPAPAAPGPGHGGSETISYRSSAPGLGGRGSVGELGANARGGTLVVDLRATGAGRE